MGPGLNKDAFRSQAQGLSWGLSLSLSLCSPGQFIPLLLSPQRGASGFSIYRIKDDFPTAAKLHLFDSSDELVCLVSLDPKSKLRGERI